MKTCLLTGGTGLIGSQLLGELPDKGWNIIALTRRGSHGHHPGKGRGIQHISCDFSRDENRTEWPGKVDAVIHLAQSERFRDFPEHAEEIFRVNTLSTLSLLDHARSSGAKTFIYASSGGIYGTSAQPLKEEPFSPSLQMEFYPATKICSEMLCQAYRQHLRVIILRFFFVYGPGQRPAMLIPRMVNSVRDGKPVTLQGN
ncbi:MAG: NAD-dependent epimerase/dehydratase family protein, partial [Candidatus Omnitrophota bacterium]|nr:NAD-dependent epimerase/dehydratase family protein [Candidatus Omnitrophota bacterium]